jgi:hypothetical protein
MSRVNITLNGQSVGFLRVSDRFIDRDPMPLPIQELEGKDTGLCLATEIRGLPAAMLIFPWEKNEIDLTEPLRWFAKSENEKPLQSDKREKYSLTSLANFAGDIHLAKENIQVNFRSERYDRNRESRGIELYLDIDDEKHSVVHVRCDFLEHPFIDDGHLHGTFNSLWYSPLSRQKTTKVKIERCVVKRQA